MRAVHAGDRAFDRLDQGQPIAAAETATIATERNPLSADPLFELAAIDQARGDLKGAQAALEKAVELQPATAEAWRQLGDLRLNALERRQGRAQRLPGGLLPGPAQRRRRRPTCSRPAAPLRALRAHSPRHKAGPQRRQAAPGAHAHVLEARALAASPRSDVAV